MKGRVCLAVGMIYVCVCGMYVHLARDKRRRGRDLSTRSR